MFPNFVFPACVGWAIGFVGVCGGRVFNKGKKCKGIVERIGGIGLKETKGGKRGANRGP